LLHNWHNHPMLPMLLTMQTCYWVHWQNKLNKNDEIKKNNENENKIIFVSFSLFSLKFLLNKFYSSLNLKIRKILLKFIVFIYDSSFFSCVYICFCFSLFPCYFYW
jgi:hypothetical protein